MVSAGYNTHMGKVQYTDTQSNMPQNQLADQNLICWLQPCTVLCLIVQHQKPTFLLMVVLCNILRNKFLILASIWGKFGLHTYWNRIRSAADKSFALSDSNLQFFECKMCWGMVVQPYTVRARYGYILDLVLKPPFYQAFNVFHK